MTKNSILSIFICFLTLSTMFAQAPQMINYQGVALNGAGLPLSNQTISIRATIRNLSPGGAILHSETRSLATESGGLFNFQIGGPGSSASSGTWSTINWSTGQKYLQIEMDVSGGTNFIDMGTQQLVSVPYAQYSNLSGGLIPSATINPNQINPGGATTNQVLQFNGTNWAPGTISGGGAFALPYAGTDASNTSFAITNTTGTAIRGQATTGFGVFGEAQGSTGTGVYGLANSASGIGVHGESTAGAGVKGYGNNAGSYGLYGTSLAGTGVYATSFSGKALDVNGNVKIAGGNTNPSAGAVLTSDAAGNASWKPTKVAFEATEGGGTLPINHGVLTTMSLATEVYDAGNNFNTSAAATDPNTFIAPVAGAYHFSAHVYILLSSVLYNLTLCHIELYKNGNPIGVVTSGGPLNTGTLSFTGITISQTVHLNAGDKIKVVVYQTNENNLQARYYNTSFSGHLVFAD